MSESTSPVSSSDDLQFDTVEPGDTSSPSTTLGKSCVVCQTPIVTTYYALGDQVLCPGCNSKMNAPLEGSKVGRFLKASFMGAGAGLLGAVIWFAVRRVANLEAGIVAILVGFMVGIAVRKGSGGRGGRGYQVLAVVITYACIAANYMPDVVEAVFQDARERQQAAAQPADGNQNQVEAENGIVAAGANADAEKTLPDMGTVAVIIASAALLLFAFIFSLALPFLQGMENIIGLLIIAFALWQAWKLNARQQLPVSGPYQLGPSPAAV